MTNGFDERLELDRIDYEGNYCPENCRFVDYVRQANNRSNNHYLTCFGERKSIADWVRDKRCKVGYAAIKSRLRRNWPDEKIITTPQKGKNLMANVDKSKVSKARNTLRYALKKGKVVKPTCCQREGCVRSDIQAHFHHGYDNPKTLDVVWLCREHIEESLRRTAT